MADGPSAVVQDTPEDRARRAREMISARGGAMNAENLNRAMQMMNGSRTDGQDFIKELIGRATGTQGGTAATTRSPASAQDRSSSTAPTASGTPMDLPTPPNDPNSGVRPDASVANLPQLAEAVAATRPPTRFQPNMNPATDAPASDPYQPQQRAPVGGVSDPTGGFDPGAAFAPGPRTPEPDNSMLNARSLIQQQLTRTRQDATDPNSTLMRTLMAMGSGGLRGVNRVPSAALANAPRPITTPTMTPEAANAARPPVPAPPVPQMAPELATAARPPVPPAPPRVPGPEAATAPVPPGMLPPRFAPPVDRAARAAQAEAARPPNSGATPTPQQASAARPPSLPSSGTPPAELATAARPPGVGMTPAHETFLPPRNPTLAEAVAARPPSAAPAPSHAEANAARPPSDATRVMLEGMFRRRGMSKADSREMAAYELARRTR